MNPDAKRTAADEWLIGLLIFLAAALVRLFFLSELWRSSYLGNIRVSDAEAYFQLAGQIASGSLDPEKPFWQAPLYPMLLAGFQRLFGESLRAIQFAHVAVGALCCVLVHRLTLRMFGFPSAVAAAVMAIFYAPFWLFDIQPLPANLTMLLNLVLVSVVMDFAVRGGIWRVAAAGLLLGGAIISHGLAIFTVPVFVFSLWRVAAKVPGDRVARGLALAIFLFLVVLPPASVSLRNSRAAGEAVFISYNAGINLFIGNSPDLEETLARRGGLEWDGLFVDAEASGATGPAEQNRFFVARAVEAAADAPVAVLKTVARKVLMSFSATEAKRNFPIYPLREDSRLLAFFLYQVEVLGLVVFAFPAGLMWPLMVLGFAAAIRNARGGGAIEWLPGAVALFHILGMIVFFPAARYRIPALILLMPYAAAIAVAIADRVRTRVLKNGSSEQMWIAWDLGPARRLVIAAAILFFISNAVSSNLFRHPVKDLAENHHLNSVWAFQEFAARRDPRVLGRLLDRANQARAIDPSYPDPVNTLAVYYLERDYARAMSLFEELREMTPGDKSVLAQIRKAKRFAPTR